MKKNILMAVFCLILSAMSFAQVPQMMSYQAVVRGSDNNLVVNQQISMRVSILQESTDGVAIYTETHSATTNANGLASIEIGNGTSNDDFSAINWANGPYFVKTETDVNGGENYEIVGVSQLLSVPYAMYAQSAGNIPDVSGFITADDVPSQINADWNAASGAAQILNKPDIDALVARLDSIAAALNNVDALANGFTDERDGNRYHAVRIGNQIWMAENLHYAGSIALGAEANSTIPYRYYPNGDASKVQTFGYLYNWPAAMNGESASNTNPSGVQGICPNGWHLPSDAEWTQLTDYLSSMNEYLCSGSSVNIAKSIASTTGWSSSTNACAVGNTPSNNNATGFAAQSAGYYNGSYGGFGSNTAFWSATENDSSHAYNRYLYYNNADVSKNGDYMGNGRSVRCVKD